MKVMNMLKLGCLIGIVLVASLIPLVKSDGVVSHSFEVQGAKMVSEGGYFWFSLNNSRFVGDVQLQIDFILQFNSKFRLLAVRINGVLSNETVGDIADSGEYNKFFTFRLEHYKVAEFLFVAPLLSVGVNFSIYHFSFHKIDFDTIVFPVEVVSLKTFDPSINPLYYQLQKELNFLNKKLEIILNQTMFDWNEYSNYPMWYNFTKEFAEKHGLTPLVPKCFDSNIVNGCLIVIAFLSGSLIGVMMVNSGLIKKKEEKK